MPPSKFTIKHKPTPAIHTTHTHTRDLGWDSPSNILNLATLFTPSIAQITLLERGLSFIPRPTKLDREELQRDVHNFHRRIKLIDYFHLHPVRHATPFTHPSNWEPQNNTLHPLTHQLMKTNRRALQRFRPRPDRSDNLTGPERRALKELHHNPNIIIKPADKGSKIIIMDRSQYILEANRQLHNTTYYKPLDNTIQTQTQLTLRTIIQTLYNKKFINNKQKEYLFGPDHPRPRYFYLLPKIHKDPATWTIPFEVPPGRPIVSDCNSSTYHISRYIDSFLGPLSTQHPSYLKDTYHFIQIIRSMAVPPSSFLFTIDINNLYTNINTQIGLHTIRNIFNNKPDPNRPDNELLQLIQLCLTHNDFLFNNQYYLQIHGTAMGQRFAPSYANLYMSEWEREALNKCPLQPLLYLRFLDDIFGIWPHSLSQFTDFCAILNSHHPSIKITHTISPDSINFLDTTVFFSITGPQHKTLHTKVYFKPTDTHALLHKSSYHPKHTFSAIIKSQIIRFHRICSHIQDFHSATSILFNSLKQRGYSKRFLRTIKYSTLASLAPTRSSPSPPHLPPSIPPQVSEVESSPPPSPYPNPGLYPSSSPTPTLNPYPNQGLYPPPSPSPSGVGDDSTTHPPTPSQPHIIPFISTFSHKTTAIHHILKQNFNNFQTRHPALQNHQLISAYRKNQSLHSILIRSLFTDNKPHTLDTFHKYYRHRKFIQNPHTHLEAPITGSFSLSTSNAIYIITCTHCHKHYIGETKNTIRIRLSQHLRNIGIGRLGTPLVQHFQTHSPNHLIVSVLQNNDRWSCGQRKRAERIWIHKLGTTIPGGLNDD